MDINSVRPQLSGFELLHLRSHLFYALVFRKRGEWYHRSINPPWRPATQWPDNLGLVANVESGRRVPLSQLFWQRAICRYLVRHAPPIAMVLDGVETSVARIITSVLGKIKSVCCSRRSIFVCFFLRVGGSASHINIKSNNNWETKS